jgi:ribosomal protein S27E
MLIETTCPGCGRKLQVAAEHAGKQASCPLCSEIYHVPTPSKKDESPQSEQHTPQAWRMQTPEGQTYGPVGKAELDAWVTEGRVSANCLLNSEQDSRWVNADIVYPAIAEASDPLPVDATSPKQHFVAGHRGALILALGIISWMSCFPIFGICAWVMGSADLREMRARRMDTNGSGLTQAGHVLGMLHAMLMIVGSVVFVFVLLLGIGWR